MTVLAYAHLDRKQVSLTVRLQIASSVVEEGSCRIVQWVASSRYRRSMGDDVSVIFAMSLGVRYKFLPG